MINRIKAIYAKYKEIINYIFFGALTTVVNLLIKYMLLFNFLDATIPEQLQEAVVISWVLAVIFAYFTNRSFVFSSKNKGRLKEFTKFTLGRISTLLLEMFIMWFFINFLKLDSNMYVIIFTLISQVLVIVGNYFISKLIVFKNKKIKTIAL